MRRHSTDIEMPLYWRRQDGGDHDATGGSPMFPLKLESYLAGDYSAAQLQAGCGATRFRGGRIRLLVHENRNYSLFNLEIRAAAPRYGGRRRLSGGRFGLRWRENGPEGAGGRGAPFASSAQSGARAAPARNARPRPHAGAHAIRAKQGPPRPARRRRRRRHLQCPPRPARRWGGRNGSERNTKEERHAGYGPGASAGGLWTVVQGGRNGPRRRGGMTKHDNS